MADVTKFIFRKVIFTMKSKHGYYIIKIIIVLCLTLNIISYIYNNITHNKKFNAPNHLTYNFSLNIPIGDYKYSTDLDVLNINNGTSLDEEFTKKHTYLNITHDTKIIYNQYVVTKNNVYIMTEVNDKLIALNYPDLISKENLCNLRNKIDNNEFLKVSPFNDPIYCLIQDGTDSYIMNIETGEKTWSGGNYYESPEINYTNDTLECGGDLSSNRYIFDKYGTLQQTKSPAFPVISVINISSILSILFILLIIINCNPKTILEKTLYTIVIIILMLFFIGVLLLTLLFY